MKEKKSFKNKQYDVIQTPLGTLYLIFASSRLSGISFERPQGVPIINSDSISDAKTQLLEYFNKRRIVFNVETEFREGTMFERMVWSLLQEIPYGETRTYKWLAERTGTPRAFRAVGNALGKNPIPIIFPCHRVIESDGKLGGFSWGLEIKRRLLDIEYYTKMSRE